jgi:hypothetical protein
VTGPLSIPKIYNAKDRTFFMFGFENYHEASPSPTLTSTITATERKGDFSAPGEPIIYNPYSTRLDSAGRCCIRDPFPNNIIPASFLTASAGAKLAQAYPDPNVGGANTLASNYNTGVNLSQDHFRNWIGRVDQNFGQRERLYIRYGHNRRNQVDNGAYNFQGPLLDAQDPLSRTNDNAVIDSLTVFNEHVILDIRASLARYNQTTSRQRVTGFDDTTLGFSSAFNDSRFNAVPRVSHCKVRVFPMQVLGIQASISATLSVFSQVSRSSMAGIRCTWALISVISVTTPEAARSFMEVATSPSVPISRR